MIVSDTNWQHALKSAGRAKYKAVAQAIREGIVSGQLQPDAQLPTVRDMAFRIGVTPGTVARAYGILVDEGRLVAGVGRGTFVAGGAPRAVPLQAPLLHNVDEATADFRSTRVPDVGQGLLIDAAFARLAQAHRRRHINYPTAETDLAARVAVASWLTPGRPGPLGPEDIVLGNGAQNCNILCLMDVLRGAAPVILTEDLSYPGVRHAARLLRAKLVGVPMDDQGLIPEALAAIQKDTGAQVLLTAAEIHSPTTIHTPLARKQQIAAVAERHRLTIIEDDCHTIADVPTPCYRALLPDQCYVVSSLTKAVSGALRFGYAVAPKGRGDSLRQVAQSAFYGVSQPVLDVCEDLLTSGDAARIRAQVLEKTALRVRQAVNVLGSHDLRWREDAPFVWLNMPRGWRSSSFVIACERRGITVRGADEFALADGRAPNAVRLGVNTCAADAVYARAVQDMNDLLQSPPAGMDG